MGIQNDIKLWDQVQVRVLDVRLISLATYEFIRNYVLPTSAFVYVQGRGQVWLDEEVWTTNQFLLLHGGKGRRLTLEATGVMEVHLILYKSTLPSNVLVEYRMMLNQRNPFEESWATVPDHTLELRELVRNIHECWSGQERVGKIQVKVYFFNWYSLSCYSGVACLTKFNSLRLPIRFCDISKLITGNPSHLIRLPSP